MVVIELVLVDFDDTLVATAERFQRARQQLFALLVSQGFDETHARHVHHHEVDPGMRERFGFGPQRLPPSFQLTYRRLCSAARTEAQPDVLAECARLGEAVAGPPPPIDGAIDALRALAARFRTAVYTQTGDADYQLDCIRGAGVLQVLPIDRVHILPRKTVAEFRETVRQYQIRDPQHVWMVGNSLRSDINPALEAGANAILIEQDDPWEYDMVEPFAPTFQRVRSFVEAAAYLMNGAGRPPATDSHPR